MGCSAQTFCSSESWAECWSAFCLTCYRCNEGEVNFPVQKNLDEDGLELGKRDGIYQCLVACKGGHIMVQFQCETCHYQNFYGKDPMWFKLEARVIKQFIRCENLDAFWSRSTSTVENNLKEGIKG